MRRRSHVIVVDVVQIIAAPLSEAPRPGKEDDTISTLSVVFTRQKQLQLKLTYSVLQITDEREEA